jgi:SET domain
LPAWVCHNDDVFMQVESLLTALEQVVELLPVVKEIAKRLPLILRYNILSVETCAELLSYPGPDGHSSLAGVGLYHMPSFFNHSAKPAVNRWCVGDVMGFVTNRDVKADTGLCISYMEHDVLCEPAWRRNQMLAMDFTDSDSIAAGGDDNSNNELLSYNDPTNDDDEGPDMPVVDSDVQNELMAMDPFERLSAIDELMQQAIGEKHPEEEATEGEGMMEGTGGGRRIIPWFQCDVHNLRILKAITLDGLGQTAEALALWQESVAFVERKLPPLDESLVVLHAQAALCAWQAAGKEDVARQHAAAAVETHNLLFGGGVARFRRRLNKDLQLALRPTFTAGSGDTSPADILWPIS